MNEDAKTVCRQCGHENDKGTKYCLLCGALLDSEPTKQPVRAKKPGRLPFRNANTKAVCRNCGEIYSEDDRYCRYCGAPNGSPKYIEEEIQCIYGPMPVKRIHTCEKCGYTWDTVLMIDKERFCPRCGGSAPAAKQDEDAPTPLAVPEEEDRQVFCANCKAPYSDKLQFCPNCGAPKEKEPPFDETISETLYGPPCPKKMTNIFDRLRDWIRLR